MARLSDPSKGYAPLLGSESGDENNVKEKLPLQRQRTRGRPAFAVICVAIVCLAIGFTIGLFLRHNSRPSIAPHKSCLYPTLRHEWRSLSKKEKTAYVQAVQCLRTVPSRLGLNHTLFDDFPYFHSRTGESGMFFQL